MKKSVLLFCVFVCVFCTSYSEQPKNESISLNIFFQLYPQCYQDIIIQNQVVQKGFYICDQRLDFLRPILNHYDRSFSVLDIGACEGYFSFKIAEEYSAFCTMIEGGYYKEKPDKLLRLCECNGHLKNICLLKEKLNLNSLQKLSQKEHFDVVLAFLVVHQMAAQETKKNDSLENVKKYINLILSLGDNVIFETTINLYPEIDQYVSNLCKEKYGCYLGEMSRNSSNINKPDVRFYWFKHHTDTKANLKISKKSFKDFNGIYPLGFAEK